MGKDSEKTIFTNKKNLNILDLEGAKSGFSSTQEIPRKTFVGRIPTIQHAFLEIMDDEKRRITLGEDDVTIGRTPECDIQILASNVSRKHARILYHNEEYRIEDLGSTNGIFVNGVKVERCVLRKHDVLEIGGIKILFIEEKIRQDNDNCQK
jgi:pSer/pThr/pTyr-binding forkhead associated (FHA) protein